jgi:hypothetical protein
MYKITLDLYLNEKIADNLKSDFFCSLEKLGVLIDAENKLNTLEHFRYRGNDQDEINLLNSVLELLKELHNEVLNQDMNVVYNDSNYSRLLITIDDIILEARKVNYSEDGDPHKEHISIFNFNNSSKIRVKELVYKKLLERGILIMKEVIEEIN